MLTANCRVTIHREYVGIFGDHLYYNDWGGEHLRAVIETLPVEIACVTGLRHDVA